MLVLELTLIVCLILLNGFLAMTELAVVSARPAALQARAERGSRGAEVALELVARPGRFLSTVQIGITMIGILAGAYGGVTLGERLAPVLAELPGLAPIARPLAIGLVVAAVTALSVVVGELTPKRMALAAAEPIAAAVARPMRLLSRLAAPVVWLLDVASLRLLRLLGFAEGARGGVTDDEIRALIAEARRTGIVAEAEGEMIDSVMRLADRSVRALMTPRAEVVWLDLDAPEEENRRRIARHGFDRYPVARGRIDDIAGVLDTQTLLRSLLEGGAFDIAAIMRPPTVMPETASALKVMTALRRAEVHLVLVVDELGSLEGIVTTSDLTRAVMGALPGETDAGRAVRREDGSWLLDGALSLDEAGARLGVSLAAGRDYSTLAGLVLALMRRIPRTGEHVEHQGWRLEVVDMDGRRIDKILASRARN